MQQAQEDRKQREALQALQMQHLQAQIGETQAQAQQRQAAVQEAQRKAAELQRQQALIAKAFAPVSPIQANVQSGAQGPRPEALNVVGARPQVDYQQLIAQGVPAELVKHLAEAPNLGMPEVARTIEGKGRTGPPGHAAVRQTGPADRAGRAAVEGAREGRHRRSGAVRRSGDAGCTLDGEEDPDPDSVASNAVAGQQRTGEAATGIRPAAAEGQYDAERGVMVDPRTGQATQVTMGGQPLGPKNKDLTESQSNAVAFAMRAQNALENLQKSGNIGVYDYSASRVPGVGNAMMSSDKGQAMNAEKQFIAAVPRKESGAAISQGEYDSYGRSSSLDQGDDAATLEQKARNREVAIQGCESRRAWSVADRLDSWAPTTCAGGATAWSVPHSREGVTHAHLPHPGPDGSVLRIEGPEGATAEQLQARRSILHASPALILPDLGWRRPDGVYGRLDVPLQALGKAHQHRARNRPGCLACLGTTSKDSRTNDRWLNATGAGKVGNVAGSIARCFRRSGSWR